jgi:hypothetical protein
MDEDEANRTTIDAYEKEAENYIRNTPDNYQPHHKPMLVWIDAAVKGLKGNNVLEIGSATSRDAKYMRNKGFVVQTSDATKKFVNYLRQGGDNALQLNILTDPIPKGYDLIFANAVAPHFTPKDLAIFLDKTYKAIPLGGRVAFNLKIGKSESWIHEKFAAKRFIHHWEPTDVEALLTNYNFKIIFFDINPVGDLPTHHWINIVVEKRKKAEGLDRKWNEKKRISHYLRPLLDLVRSAKP